MDDSLFISHSIKEDRWYGGKFPRRRTSLSSEQNISVSIGMSQCLPECVISWTTFFSGITSRAIPQSETVPFNRQLLGGNFSLVILPLSCPTQNIQ